MDRRRYKTYNTKRNNSVRNLIFVIVTFLILFGLLIGGIVFFITNYIVDDNNHGNFDTGVQSEEINEENGFFGFFKNIFSDDDNVDVEDDLSSKNIYIKNIKEGDVISKGSTLKMDLYANDIFEKGNTYVFVGVYDINESEYVFDKTINNVKGQINEEISFDTGNLKEGEYYIDAIISDMDDSDADLVDLGCVFTIKIKIE